MFIWKPVPGHVLNDMCFLKENYLFLIKCMLHVWKELSFSSRNPHPLNKECLLKTDLVRSLQTVRKLFFPFSFGFCFFPLLWGEIVSWLMTIWNGYVWVGLGFQIVSEFCCFVCSFFRWDIVPWLIEIQSQRISSRLCVPWRGGAAYACNCIHCIHRYWYMDMRRAIQGH